MYKMLNLPWKTKSGFFHMPSFVTLGDVNFSQAPFSFFRLLAFTTSMSALVWILLFFCWQSHLTCSLLFPYIAPTVGDPEIGNLVCLLLTIHSMIQEEHRSCPSHIAIYCSGCLQSHQDALGNALLTTLSQVTSLLSCHVFPNVVCIVLLPRRVCCYVQWCLDMIFTLKPCADLPLFFAR